MFVITFVQSNYWLWGLAYCVFTVIPQEFYLNSNQLNNQPKAITISYQPKFGMPYRTAKSMPTLSSSTEFKRLIDLINLFSFKEKQ